MRFMKHKREPASEDDDPLSGVANLFDVAMMFAVGLLVTSEEGAAGTEPRSVDVSVLYEIALMLCVVYLIGRFR